MSPLLPLAMMVLWGLSPSACDPSGGDSGSRVDGSNSDGSSSSNSSGGTSGADASGDSNACTDPALDSECEDAARCPEERCADELSQCYGQSYAAGIYGGPCKQDLECRAACGTAESCDAACVSQCPVSPDCQACVETSVTPCLYRECFSLVNSCGATGAGGGKTCVELQACCNGLGGTNRESCQAQYDTVYESGDDLCALVYENFITQGLCQ